MRSKNSGRQWLRMSGLFAASGLLYLASLPTLGDPVIAAILAILAFVILAPLFLERVSSGPTQRRHRRIADAKMDPARNVRPSSALTTPAMAKSQRGAMPQAFGREALR